MNTNENPTIEVNPDSKKGFFSKLQLPKRAVDESYPFYFKVYNFKTDGLIFLTTALFVPFGISLFFYILNVTSVITVDNYLGIINQGIYFFSALVGFLILNSRDSQLFRRSGLMFYFIPIFVNLAIGIILAALLAFLNGIISTEIISMIVQILSTILLIWMILNFTSNVWKRIKKTLKENFLMVLIVSIITALLMWTISGPLFNLIFDGTPLVGSSNNQNGLIVGSGIANAILLFIYTVLIAPLFEELIYRNAWFTGVGNKTAAILSSALMFALMHVMSGDFEHIFPYLIGGLFLSGIFTIARGNVTYSWITHMLYNLISVILTFIFFWSW